MLSQIPRILWNLKVHYTSQSPVVMLSQMNPTHTPNQISLTFILILSFHLRPVLRVISFLQASQPKCCTHFSSYHACYTLCPKCQK
jgi:hypothetical protein